MRIVLGSVESSADFEVQTSESLLHAIAPVEDVCRLPRSNRQLSAVRLFEVDIQGSHPKHLGFIEVINNDVGLAATPANVLEVELVAKGDKAHEDAQQKDCDY